MGDTALNQNDAKPWAPIPAVVHYVRQRMGGAKRVLDVGAGYAPFPFATHTVDVVPRQQQNLIGAQANFRSDRLPFEDKFFDFVWCRHTVEDLDDATHLLSEMSRVGKRGYIETPSPLAELCRGIDGGSPTWRGYWHHRSLVWEEDGKLALLPKLARVEFLNLNDELLVQALRTNVALGNTYFFWENSISFMHPWDESHMNHELGKPHKPYEEMIMGAVVNGHAASAAALTMMNAALQAGLTQ